MNMQMIMQQAKKMQMQLQKDQEELEKKEYEGTSSLVNIKINGKYEIVSVKINLEDNQALEADDVDMLEDMIMVAMNDAIKKLTKDKEDKLGKYGQGLAGLM